MINKESLPEQIISQCLSIDDQLKTIMKSLRTDGEDIDGFSDHYSNQVQQIIDINWKNHDLAYELSSKDYKLDKIRELCD